VVCLVQCKGLLIGVSCTVCGCVGVSCTVCVCGCVDVSCTVCVCVWVCRCVLYSVCKSVGWCVLYSVRVFWLVCLVQCVGVSFTVFGSVDVSCTVYVGLSVCLVQCVGVPVSFVQCGWFCWLERMPTGCTRSREQGRWTQFIFRYYFPPPPSPKPISGPSTLYHSRVQPNSTN